MTLSVCPDGLDSRFGGRLRMRLQRFPLRHQVSDFPHQRLMAIDDLLRAFSVLIEAGGRHLRFKLFDLSFAVGYPALQVGNPFLQRLCRAVSLPALGLELLAS